MLTFVKLGGSLITDKQQENTFRQDVAARIAQEIHIGLTKRQDLRLLVGHGSGSFGHVAAKRFGTMQGVHTPEGWRGYAQVANIAAELNYLITQTLQSAGVPVIRIQPSASALARDGEVVSMSMPPIRNAIAHNLVPLVYGDVALDEVRGGTIISTESVFTYLAHNLPVNEILELGDTDGVYAHDGSVISRITPDTYAAIESALGGSAGTDVTGGMRSKVQDLLKLVQSIPHLTVRIMSGTTPGLLADTLAGHIQSGTLITSG
ncbi:MAG: isopentenyl phosphate kinase [Chloroflexota bacterium]|nr:isopentenyl phosphate kinase [Chloroflexota bacterium]